MSNDELIAALNSILASGSTWNVACGVISLRDRLLGLPEKKWDFSPIQAAMDRESKPAQEVTA